MLTHSDPSALILVRINRNPKTANCAVTDFSIIPFQIFYWEYLIFFLEINFSLDERKNLNCWGWMKKDIARNVTPKRTKVDKLYSKLRETSNQGLGNKDFSRQISNWKVEPYKSEFFGEKGGNPRDNTPGSYWRGGNSTRGKNLSTTPAKVDSGLRATKRTDSRPQFGGDSLAQVDIVKIYKNNISKYTKWNDQRTDRHHKEADQSVKRMYEASPISQRFKVKPPSHSLANIDASNSIPSSGEKNHQPSRATISNANEPAFGCSNKMQESGGQNQTVNFKNIWQGARNVPSRESEQIIEGRTLTKSQALAAKQSSRRVPAYEHG
jgi:hypothetical protein